MKETTHYKYGGYIRCGKVDSLLVVSSTDKSKVNCLTCLKGMYIDNKYTPNQESLDNLPSLKKFIEKSVARQRK